MAKSLKPVEKTNLIQAVLIADTFNDEFIPISNDIPLSLMPIANTPLIDYTLEFLSLGGVQEVFVFCCNHVAQIRLFISTCIENVVGWSLNLKVHIIESDKCRSLGDCLRDLDAKGVLNSEFVLIEPGVIANYNLKALIEHHKENCKLDNSAVMTLVYEEYATEHAKICPQDELVIALDENNKVVYHKKLYKSTEKYIPFPIHIFNNSEISVRSDLKDVHIAICSASVLPLFSDNFDFQSKDDFIRGLLMNDEIIEGSIYSYISEGDEYGSAAFTWRTYQSVGMELLGDWFSPIAPNMSKGKYFGDNSFTSTKTNLNDLSLNKKKFVNSIIGSDVNICEPVKIENSVIFDNVQIENNVTISSSIIGPNCIIKKGASITNGSVLGKNVIIDSQLIITNCLLQSTPPLNCTPKDKFGSAYLTRTSNAQDDHDLMSKNFEKLTINNDDSDYSNLYDSSSAESDNDSSERSVLEDTKLFFNEVLDSLNRGYEDKLPCDNLILEINSSRYAYNVTVKEVNFNVIKAILTLSLNIQQTDRREICRFLSYFNPILENYIKNPNAMIDCLQALQEVFKTQNDLKPSWTLTIVKFLYDKDYVSEEVILKWYDDVLEEGDQFTEQLKSFVKWLREAEEESSDDDN